MATDKKVKPNIDLDKEFKSLFNLIQKLGWDIAIPAGGGPEDDGNVKGMIIGEPSYINYILKHLK